MTFFVADVNRMKGTLKYFLLIAISLLLSSCSYIPCKKQVDIITYESTADISIINKEYTVNIKLQENEKKSINISMFSSGIIEINTPTQFQVLDFGERDHWLPMKHKIILKIHDEQIIYSSGKLIMRVIATNREDYDLLFQNNQN